MWSCKASVKPVFEMEYYVGKFLIHNKSLGTEISTLQEEIRSGQIKYLKSRWRRFFLSLADMFKGTWNDSWLCKEEKRSWNYMLLFFSLFFSQIFDFWLNRKSFIYMWDFQREKKTIWWSFCYLIDIININMLYKKDHQRSSETPFFKFYVCLYACIHQI